MSNRAVWQACFLILMLCLPQSVSMAYAQDAQIRIGRETYLPIPRYISINTSTANMRRGPSLDYPIDWTYNLKGLPVRVIGESGHWRKIEDYEGVRGWFHYALLSGTRTVLVMDERVAINEKPGQAQQLVAVLERGVVAKIMACQPQWCRVEVDNHQGWLPKSAVWGVDENEVFEK